MSTSQSQPGNPIARGAFGDTDTDTTATALLVDVELETTVSQVRPIHKRLRE